MKLFINDKPVNLVALKNLNQNLPFDVVVNRYDDIGDTKLHGHVLINNVTTLHINELLRIMRNRKLKKLKSLTLTGADYAALKKQIKSRFKIIKAGGGIVIKNDHYLMIYRLKKWDLPKGKLDDGEKSKAGAIREVEEECNVKVKLNKKICTTWHTYVRDSKSILKRTKWYLMDCLDDSEMKPQLEEDIEDIRWMTEAETKIALENSYQSIFEVFRRLAEQKVG